MWLRTKRLGLLLRKNWTIKIKQGWLSLLAALFFPIILLGIIAALRPVAKPEEKPNNSDGYDNCVTQGYANPSAGILPWLQTIVCGVSPTCDGKSIPSLDNGSTDTFISWNGTDLDIPCYKKGESITGLAEQFDQTLFEDSTFNTLFQVKDPALETAAANFANFVQTTNTQTAGLTTAQTNQIIINQQTELCNLTSTFIESNYNAFWNILHPIWKGKIIVTNADAPVIQNIMNNIVTEYFTPLSNFYTELDIDLVNILQKLLANDVSDAAPLVILSSFCAVPANERFVKVGPNDDLATLINEIQQAEEFWAVVNFENVDSTSTKLPNHVKYNIQQTLQQIPPTFEMKPNQDQPSDYVGNRYTRYIKGGFIYLQDMLDHSIAKLASETSGNYQNIGSFMQMLPYPCYQTDDYRGGPR